MVGTAQPRCLFASGIERRRYESTMNLRKRKTHSVSFHSWGWTARPFPLRFAVAGEAFVLTSPFIERDSRNVARGLCRSESHIPISGTYQDLATCLAESRSGNSFRVVDYSP